MRLNFQMQQIKPGVIIHLILCKYFLIINASMLQNQLVNFFLATKLFLKLQILTIEFFAFILCNFLETKAKDLSCSVKFLIACFKACKFQKIFLTNSLLSQIFQSALKYLSRLFKILLFIFKTSHF